MARDPFAPVVGPLSDRRIGIIPQVLHFDRRGCGPCVISLVVNANLDPSLHYPEARVALGQHHTGEIPDFGGVLLTIANIDALIEQLKTARAAVVKACPSLAYDHPGMADLS